MHYCCKGISNCCDAIGSCCDSCCKTCCDGCNATCEGCAECIGQCFNRPFSFCLFISFFVCFAPIGLGIAGLSGASSISCSEPIKAHFIVIMVINLLNWLFLGYLCYRYGVPYKQGGDPSRQEMNVLQRTQNLILYDFVVCFFIFFLIFEIVWLIIGGVWDNSEPSNSPCSLTDAGKSLLSFHRASLVILWIYLAVGAFVFIMTIIIYACDEGSCTMHDTCRFTWLCCTCGLCDIGKSQKPKKQTYQQQTYVDNSAASNNNSSNIDNQSPQYYQERRQNYPEKRNDWLTSSMNLLGKFGWGKKAPTNNNNYQQQPVIMIAQQLPPQNNPNMIILSQPATQNQMNSNQQQQGYPQLYHQESGYEQPQPQYQQQQGGEPIQWRQQNYSSQPQQGGMNYAPSQNQNPPPKKEEGIMDKAKGALNSLMGAGKKKPNQ